METIVVGAAQTETAALAVERAATVAAAMGARLVVVTAFEGAETDVVGVGSDTFVLSPAQQAIDFAEQTAGRLAAANGIETGWRAIQGKPESVVLDIAREVDASIIVVGNVRMQGPKRVLGSVANHIAHHAPCDVLVVKTV